MAAAQGFWGGFLRTSTDPVNREASRNQGNEKSRNTSENQQFHGVYSFARLWEKANFRIWPDSLSCGYVPPNFP
jgi:hypothetical protein